MGKGDIKTKRGKIVNGSYGVKRLKNKTKAPIIVEEKAEVEKPKPAAKTRKTKVKEESAD
ncbi:MAG: 30S ribosomal protein THX [Bacteroidales bacterium]|nr:30S ribosomal protein THX [Bacteroidales bacterium]